MQLTKIRFCLLKIIQDRNQQPHHMQDQFRNRLIKENILTSLCHQWVMRITALELFSEMDFLLNNILPHLHIKTHYKAATQFTLAYPGSFYCPTTTNLGEAIEKAKSDKEKLSQRNLFNAFKNIEYERKGSSKLMRQTSQAMENQEVDIPRLTKNILVDCNVIRRKTQEIQEEINLKMNRRFKSHIKFNSIQRDKKQKFRDNSNNAYNDRSKLSISKPVIVMPIDSKFVSSDEESDIGKIPVKKIKVHKDNIFSKTMANLEIPIEIKTQMEAPVPLADE